MAADMTSRVVMVSGAWTSAKQRQIQLQLLLPCWMSSSRTEWAGETGHCAALLFGLGACVPGVVQKTGSTGYLVPRVPQESTEEARDEEKVWSTCGRWNPRETRMAFVPKWVFRGCIFQADPSVLCDGVMQAWCLFVSGSANGGLIYETSQCF